MFSIPPHTSQRLQPLDLCIYGPLKNAFNRECDYFLKTHRNERITHYEIASIFNLAYLKVATMDKGISGFREAGIIPFNPEKFEDEYYSENAVGELITTNNTAIMDITEPEREPEPESELNLNLLEPSRTTTSEHFPEVEITNIPSLPKNNSNGSKKQSKRQHSEIITSTPYKIQLEEKEKEKLKSAKAKMNKSSGRIRRRKKIKSSKVK